MTEPDKLYIAVFEFVRALNYKANMVVRVHTAVRNYREAFDICPIRGSWGDIARYAEKVSRALQALGLDAAMIDVDGTAYTVYRWGFISPSPIGAYLARPTVIEALTRLSRR